MVCCVCMYILNTIIVELTNSCWLHMKKFICASYSIITMPKCIRECNAKLLRTLGMTEAMLHGKCIAGCILRIHRIRYFGLKCHSNIS